MFRTYKTQRDEIQQRVDSYEVQARWFLSDKTWEQATLEEDILFAHTFNAIAEKPNWLARTLGIASLHQRRMPIIRALCQRAGKDLKDF